jgi:predicted transglutaminase-like cysteine proteinase
MKRSRVLMRHPVFFIALLLALLEAPRPFLHWNDFILENEMQVEKRFLQEYEQIEESFCDRVDDEGKQMSVKEFIRPKDVSHLVADLKGLPFHEKVEEVIRYINDHIQYCPDEAGDDYWQKPQETIARGKGDCEDLAFLAASMLIAAGLSEDSVWINIKNWHVFTTVGWEGLTLVVKTNADANYAGSYDWPVRRWNRASIEERK